MGVAVKVTGVPVQMVLPGLAEMVTVGVMEAALMVRSVPLLGATIAGLLLRIRIR